MAIHSAAPLEPRGPAYGLGDGSAGPHASLSGAVAWGAIVAGAAALSLILLILGVGLGLSSVSPWSLEGISAATFGVTTIVWLTLTQLLSSVMGGYLAGRLRTRWLDTHSDEVYFRDTAHGFLAWAVATLATAALLTSLIGTIVSGGVQAAASVAGGVAGSVAQAAGGAAGSGAATAASDAPMTYFVESLFRREPGAVTAASAVAAAPADAGERTPNSELAEVGRIFTQVSRADPLPSADLRYVGQLVAQRTGLSQQDAEKRVSDTYARAQARLAAAASAAKEAADTARKASAYAALWIFVSLLSGAFVASLAATYGGRRRDA